MVGLPFLVRNLNFRTVAPGMNQLLEKNIPDDRYCQDNASHPKIEPNLCAQIAKLPKFLI
jgi:hypothetical protein